ncbi:FHA domain-containing protein [Arenicella xantha]|uniref:FHA domain-containing protein n=1 Tax=Arenicella xantha TaxID=644221 RepID=A0A395JI32_9GAMM|nr:FHA domain-containing protein [Arenicella xantha]RBP48554.1 FHA domain-containing protein [Arenicella xantha]
MSYVRIYCGNDLRKQFELGENGATIGRTDDNVIVLADEGISRQHAAIEHQNGEYFIVDLGSSNGVFLNNEKVEKAKLKYWDEIQIHNFVIKFMAKPVLAGTKGDIDEPTADLESDKTKFFNVTDEKQLDELRNKTKECFLTYKGPSGKLRKLIIKKPRIIIGKSNQADIKITGWFAPSIAATIERHGSSYELVPTERGKVIFQNQRVSKSVKLIDDSGFIVRDIELKFFNRLTKTS